jgi:hypothetical protein
MNYLQTGFVIDPLVTLIDVALAMYMAWLATLETFARGIRTSMNPSGLSTVNLCPEIILYAASCIVEGIFDFL